ncbi:helix-turn-helix domain-containing protein [Paenibacillus flagellatus]|uniref:AraC family transcriptional regulator n=1 Tax=Paenibacillus flagellatus TaxID=2211139 RepID=A0A2V5K5L1_9BACL|nr:helix-turn-helix domain-containing protein [Paenibacillus flagellatus]PYI54052.1 AraC family transcriptional regulator [Paenibacillus flagellatus]
MKTTLRLLRIGNRKSALLTMIVSHLVILLVPLAMGLFLYAKVERSLEHGANRSNTAMLEQLKLSLDSRLTEVDNLMVQVTLNPKLDYLLKIGPDADAADRYLFIEFMRDALGRYRSLTSHFIVDYYVYFAASDTIVKPDLLTDSRTFYESFYGYEGMPYEKWRDEMLSAAHAATFMPVASLTRGTPSSTAPSIDSAPLDAVTYVQSLPIRTQTDILGSFVVLIDQSQIESMFAQLESASHSAIHVIDDKGRVVMGTADKPLPPDLLARINASDAPFGYRLGGVDQMVSVASSQKPGWKYVSVTPRDVFMQQVNQIQRWAVWLLAICTIAGLVAVYAAVYRNYRPLKKTINAIVHGKQLSGRPVSNEYEFIRQTIEGSLHEENNLRGLLAQQTPVIRANYLSRLVRGYAEIEGSSERERSLAFMDISFVGDRFAVMIVQIEDVSRFTAEESERQWALVRFILSNVGVDLARTHHEGFAVELERDRLAFLINVREDRTDEAAADDLRHIAESLHNVITTRFKIGMTVATGSVRRGEKQIGDSYAEALAALDYRIIKGRNAVIPFQDIVDVKRHYYYPLEIEVQLVNFVRSGDADNALKLLNTIYSINFDSGRMTPELGKCLFFNITSTFLKIWNASNAVQDEWLGPDFDPIKTVFSSPTAEGMHRKTKELYEALARSFKAERTDHGSQLLREIVALVDGGLDDPNLGLAMIADRLRMTPQYISTFFKKTSGQNLLDYITRKRIDQAKRLMENKELTNAQIAQKVGYTTHVVFIRAFKKLEGIPPGKYRELMFADANADADAGAAGAET